MATGITVINGKCYTFDRAGVYQGASSSVLSKDTDKTVISNHSLQAEIFQDGAK